MKLKKQIILIAAICMLFGVAGYSLSNTAINVAFAEA